MNLDELLGRAVTAGASDIHLKVSQPPMLRVDGAIRPMEGAPTLTTDDLNALLQVAGSAAPHRLAAFRETGELDASYETAEQTRFRVNAFRQRGMVSIAMRFIPRTIPSFEDLHMPPGIRRLAETHHGLVLVTGATGAGKSTTLAAMVDHINKTRSAAHRHDRGPDRDHPSRRRAASSTSARSASTPDGSARRSGARCARTRTRS